MEDTLVALASEWLEHATYGVAAQLLALPVTGTRPAAPVIVTEEDDGALARRRAPAHTSTTDVAAGRLLVAALDDTALDVEFQTGAQDGTATLLLTFDQYEADTQTALRDGRLVLRAARASLLKFNQYRTATTGVRDLVVWDAVTRFQAARREAPTGDGRVLLDLLVTCAVRDSAAEV